MSALHLGDAGLERRTLLRAAMAGAGMLALAHAAATMEPLRWPLAAPSPAQLPSAAAWEAILGEEVEVSAPDLPVTRAQVVDVRRAAAASELSPGDAYSVLLDAPALEGPSALTVKLHGADLTTTLTIMPVNGDGSWEAIIDRRRPSRRAR